MITNDTNETSGIDDAILNYDANGSTDITGINDNNYTDNANDTKENNNDTSDNTPDTFYSNDKIHQDDVTMINDISDTDSAESIDLSVDMIDSNKSNVTIVVMILMALL